MNLYPNQLRHVTAVCSDFSGLIIENRKENVLLQNTKTKQKIKQIFLKDIWQNNPATQKTGQSENEFWHQIGLRTLTASNHPNIFTKLNSAVKLISPRKPKTTPLAAQIIFREPNLKTNTTALGIQNEQVTLKMLYS